MPSYAPIVNSVKRGFRLPGGWAGQATAAFNLDRFLNGFDSSIVLNRYSPVLQKKIGSDYQNNIVITGMFRTNYDPIEANTNGGFSFIQVRKNSSGRASAYAGYGIAWRPSSPTYGGDIAITGATPNETLGAGYYDIACADPEADNRLLYLKVTEVSTPPADVEKVTYIPFNYIDHIDGSITGCFLPTHAPTASDALCHMSPNLYVVDNDPVHGDMYAAKYVTDPLTGLAYIQSGTAIIKPDTNYYFKIEIGPDNAITMYMKDSEEPFGGGDIVIIGGATRPISEYLDSPNMDSFGISVYDTCGYQWWYDNLKIATLENEMAAAYFRFDVTDMPEDLQIEINAWGEGGEGANGIVVGAWNGATWDTILTVAASDFVVAVSNIIAKSTYANGAYVDIRVTTTANSTETIPSVLHIDYIKMVRAQVMGVHMGGCLDVYVDDPGAALASTGAETVDADSYSIRLSGEDGIYNISSILYGEAELTYAKDYVIKEADPSLSNSIMARPLIKFSSDLAGKDVTVTYWESDVVASLQNTIEADAHRPLGTNVLVKHKRIHEISLTPGGADTEELVQAYLDDLPYIGGIKTISYSELSKYIYTETGSYTALVLNIKSFDGKRMRYRTISYMGQEYAINETETFRIV